MAQMSGMDKYKFRRALEQIEEAEGRGTELVSVYIPPERPIFDVTNYLRAELSQSSNIKSASTRKHVTQAIESAMQRLKAYRMPPPNGLVIFTGHKQIGADQTQMVTFVRSEERRVGKECRSRWSVANEDTTRVTCNL